MNRKNEGMTRNGSGMSNRRRFPPVVMTASGGFGHSATSLSVQENRTTSSTPLSTELN